MIVKGTLRTSAPPAVRVFVRNTFLEPGGAAMEHNGEPVRTMLARRSPRLARTMYGIPCRWIGV